MFCRSILAEWWSGPIANYVPPWQKENHLQKRCNVLVPRRVIISYFPTMVGWSKLWIQAGSWSKSIYQLKFKSDHIKLLMENNSCTSSVQKGRWSQYLQTFLLHPRVIQGFSSIQRRSSKLLEAKNQSWPKALRVFSLHFDFLRYALPSRRGDRAWWPQVKNFWKPEPAGWMFLVGNMQRLRYVKYHIQWIIFS